jgi:hypothetical protein
VRSFLIVVGGLVLAAPLQGQGHRWSFALEAGQMQFGGTSADTSTDGIGAFRPSRPSTLGLRAERGNGSVRVGLGLLYAAGPATLVGPDVSVTATGDPLTLLELAPGVSWRVAQLGAGSLRLDGGAVIDRWSWAVAPTRWRIGAEVGARVEAPLGSSTALSARLGVARTASVLEEADLPASFERRPSWRRSVAIGLLLRR